MSERTRVSLFAAFAALLVFVATQPPKAAQVTRQEPVPRDFTVSDAGEFLYINQEDFRRAWIARKYIIAVSSYPADRGLDKLPHPTVVVALPSGSFRMDVKTDVDAQRLIDALIGKPN